MGFMFRRHLRRQAMAMFGLDSSDDTDSGEEPTPDKSAQEVQNEIKDARKLARDKDGVCRADRERWGGGGSRNITAFYEPGGDLMEEEWDRPGSSQSEPEENTPPRWGVFGTVHSPTTCLEEEEDEGREWVTTAAAEIMLDQYLTSEEDEYRDITDSSMETTPEGSS